MLSSKEVLERTGISRATLNNYIGSGLIARPEVLPPGPEHGAAPRIGYFAGLGPKVGIWPGVSLAYIHSSVDIGDLGDASGYSILLQARAPLLFQPADHFFIGIGPAFQTDLISKVEDEDADKDTAFGLQTTVGGYW